jgi:hypothetical protein
MDSQQWGIRKMVSTGLGIETPAIVEPVDVPEQGTFDSKADADEQAAALGDRYFAWPSS